MIDRWNQIEAVLQDALDRPPQDRSAFLDEVCLNDAELRNETASLIAAHENAGDFIEQPALVTDAQIILNHQTADNIGREIGAYRIQECLGAGGMGEVYLAEDHRLRRRVALKLLPAYFASDDERLARFEREAQAASALNHPNILTIYEVGESNNVRFIATEFIDGETIHDLLDGDLTLTEILDVAIQVVSGLSAAHAAGIVHRDIKPDNIMRRHDGLVKLLDFGIAKLLEPALDLQPSSSRQTEVGTLLGTANYMSPEQARALPIDERSDIWSFGVVLYQLLTRRLPFAAATRMDTLVNILEREPKPVFPPDKQLPASLRALGQLVMKSLEKNRDHRYQTADELLAELKSVRKQFEVDGSANTVTELLAKLSWRDESEVSRGDSRRRATLLVAAGLLVAVIVGALASMWFVPGRSIEKPTVSVATNTALTYTAMNENQQLDFIRSEEQRISAMMGDRPGKLDEDALRSIKGQVDRYLTRKASAANGENLQVIYSRARPFLPTIANAFAAHKVPIIIGLYLPMIESEYRPCFENEFGSKGLFQFLPKTAKNYGVEADGLCDVKQVAPAAARYIADHMAELGDDAQSMTLVILSYNRGAQWVRGTLRQLRDSGDYERTFWTLYKNRERLDKSFQSEGVGYIPMFFAAAIIGENPRTFGLDLEPLSNLANASIVSANKTSSSTGSQN